MHQRKPFSSRSYNQTQTQMQREQYLKLAKDLAGKSSRDVQNISLPRSVAALIAAAATSSPSSAPETPGVHLRFTLASPALAEPASPRNPNRLLYDLHDASSQAVATTGSSWSHESQAFLEELGIDVSADFTDHFAPATVSCL